MKVGIIGAGAVGSACLLSLVMRGSAREIVLVNRDRKRAQGVVTDVQYGTVLSPPIGVSDGNYSDLDGSAVVIITAGVNEKGGGATDRSDPVGRLRLLEQGVGERSEDQGFAWTLGHAEHDQRLAGTPRLTQYGIVGCVSHTNHASDRCAISVCEP